MGIGLMPYSEEGELFPSISRKASAMEYLLAGTQALPSERPGVARVGAFVFPFTGAVFTAWMICFA